MRHVVVVFSVLALGMSYHPARAGDSCEHGHGCLHGCKKCCVEHECIAVPTKKTIKKVVYDVKCVPVCEHRPHKLIGCDCCPTCQLKYKKVLVKREIVVCEECVTTCQPVPLKCGSCPVHSDKGLEPPTGTASIGPPVPPPASIQAPVPPPIQVSID